MAAGIAGEGGPSWAGDRPRRPAARMCGVKRWVAIGLSAAVVALAVAVVLLKRRPTPGTFKEASIAAEKAREAGNHREAERLFLVTFEKADEVGNPIATATAAVNVADLAGARGDHALVKYVYDHVFRVYPDQLHPAGGQFARASNNLAVAEHYLGNDERARSLLETAAMIGAPQGTHRPTLHGGNHGVHMLILRNLARINQAIGWDARAEAAYQDLRAEVRRMQDNPRPISEAVAQTLQTYAAVFRTIGRGPEAEELETIARTYDPQLAMSWGPAFDGCEMSGPIRRCYEEIR